MPVTCNSAYANMSLLYIWKKVVVARSRLFRTVNTINGKLVCPYLNFLHILYIPTLSPLLSDTQEHIPVMCYFFNSTGKVARAGLSNSYLSESNMKFKIRLSIYLSIYLLIYTYTEQWKQLLKCYQICVLSPSELSFLKVGSSAEKILT